MCGLHVGGCLACGNIMSHGFAVLILIEVDITFKNEDLLYRA
jgi:hypothetical protein